MRLTLRTMLAYLDDILEPTDRDDIGHKIEESQFALQLVQRVRDCTRKSRLSAPPLSGKGMDPNTVAEYLDNTLAGERVPDFEKVCLESDVYLAEVAACHQILTMVLGQPAQINPEMKRRMYEIGNQAAAAPAEELKLAAADDHHAAIPDELWVKPARTKPEIPDYLRQPTKQWSWKTIVAAIVLVLVLAGAITMALGPWETNPIAGLLGLRSAKETKVAENGANSQPAANGQSSETAAAPTSTDGMPALAQPNAATGGTDAAGHMVNSKAGGVDNATMPVAPVPESTNTPPSSATVQNPSNPATANPVASNIVPTSPNPTAGIDVRGNDRPKPDDSSMPPDFPQPVTNNVATMPNRAIDAPRAAARSDIPVPGDVTLNAPRPTTDDQPSALPDADLPLGRFLPGKTVVLLKYDVPSQQWSRLPPGAALNAGDQLLVLPTYRPTLTLSAGLTLQLSPETLLQLQAPDAQGVPGIKVMSGRLVALSAGKAGTRLRLTTGSASGVVTFSDADSTLGLEVHRTLVPGADPEQQESHAVADLYAANGHFEWTPAGGNSVALTAPQRLTITATPADATAIAAAPPMNVIPKWINSPEPLRSLDENVSEVLAGSLEGGKQLPQVLVEMAGERRVEFRSIGAQSLALMDDFEPLVTAFRDEGQRPMWAAEIASVRAALARGPAVAAKFREACEKQFGDDAGKEFYRMFWGYTKDQLQRDQAAKLVENLENNELAFRAVAIADLLEITGKPMGYVATDIPINRRQPVRRWQDELRTGKIVPREPAAHP